MKTAQKTRSLRKCPGLTAHGFCPILLDANKVVSIFEFPNCDSNGLNGLIMSIQDINPSTNLLKTRKETELPWVNTWTYEGNLSEITTDQLLTGPLVSDDLHHHQFRLKNPSPSPKPTGFPAWEATLAVPFDPLAPSSTRVDLEKDSPNIV